MIQVNELRIGNLLRDKVSKTELKVIELTEKDIVTYVIDRSKFPLKSGWGLEPIPLTSEILLKCGFELTDVKTHSDNRPLTKMFYKKTLLVQHHDNGLWSFIIMGYNIVRPEMSQFLHQLQNLYFALTNEELTFNNL